MQTIYKYCPKCQKKIDKRSQTCVSCKGNTRLGIRHTAKTKRKISNSKKGKSNHRLGCHHTEKTKRKMREARKGKYSGKDSGFFGKTHTKLARAKIRKGNSKPKGHLLCTHHIDLNKKNNTERNKLNLTISKHSKLHSQAYHYLVETGNVGHYISWFDKTYGLKNVK